MVALDELRSRIINHYSLSRMTPCDLQEEVVNALSFASARVTQKHDVFCLVSSGNPDPCRRFFKPEVVPHTGDQPPGQRLFLFQSASHGFVFSGRKAGMPKPLPRCLISRAYSFAFKSRTPRRRSPAS